MSADIASTPETFLGCPQHPDAPAAYVCGRCQTAVCIDCCYSMPDGSVCCKSCFAPVASPAPVPPPIPRLRMAAPRVEAEATPIVALPPGVSCVQHPHVRPVALCRNCGRGSCVTCDFVFPGNLHLCPDCATATHAKLSPRRKQYLITAFVLAGWCSLCLMVLLGGVLAEMAQDPASQMAVGFVVILAMVLPSIVGTAMAMSALRKGLSNPVSVWIAMIWNGLALGGLMLLIVVRNFSQ